MGMRAAEIQTVLDELQLEGTSIQQIVQPDFPNLYLHVIRPGQNFWIRICLVPGFTRLHRSWTAPRKKVKVQRFAEFLRSTIRGGRIIRVEHKNQDRIICLTIRNSQKVVLMYIRLWGGAANIVVTSEDGIVLDSHYRRPNKGEVTGHHWSLPEPKNKGLYPVRTELLSQDHGDSSIPGLTDSNDMPFNQKVFLWYTKLEQKERREAMLSELDRKLDQRENALEGRLKGLSRRDEELEHEETYQRYGELLKSQIHLIQPGDQEVQVEDYWNPGKRVEVPIDPRRNPQENVQKYFHLAKKARTGKQHIEQERANYLQQLEQTQYFRLEVQDPDCTLHRMGEILEDLSAKLNPPARITKENEDQPGLEFTSHGYRIFVGRNAKENDLLLRRYTRGNDLWLHTRDYPGGYVFIRTQKGKTVPLDVLLDGGNLAVFYSKAKTSGTADLYYTQVKHLRRPKEGKLGLVLPNKEKNLRITLDPDRLANLLGRSG